MRKCVMYVPLFFFAVTLAQKAPAYWQHFFRDKICTYLDNPDKIQKKLPLLGRAVARSENLWGHIVLGEDNVPPLFEIGLADLPKWGARAPPLATGLTCISGICKYGFH